MAVLSVYPTRRMNQTNNHPEFAIIDSNTFSCIGLKNLLETILPGITVRCFNTFGALMDDTPDMYAHYFVASQIALEHTSFFLERKRRTIILVNGDNVTFSTFHTLNVGLPENKLVSVLMSMHEKGHGHPCPSYQEKKSGADSSRLSTREVEVLTLIVRGLINKEIAERLNISLNTVISHRKNITEKLGIRSVSGLTVYAIMNGLIEANQI